MLLQAEIGLMLAAIGLYLYDSALLLYGNEGVFSAVGRERWSLGFASGIQLRGKNLFIPSPLAPHRPIFRLAWQVGTRAEKGGKADPAWTERRKAFEPLAAFVWGMLAAIFVLLPLGLFTRLGDFLVLCAIAVLYLNIIATLAWIALKRADFGVSRKRLATLAFESLICSPFALNLVRKLSLDTQVDEDLVHAARRLQKDGDWDASRRAIVAQIDEELDFAEDGTPRAKALQSLRDELANEGAPA